MNADIQRNTSLGLLLRLPAVVRETGLSRSALYDAIKRGTFPAPVRIGARSVAWRRSAIEQWVSTRN
jgi:prophage regulatory protein